MKLIYKMEIFKIENHFDLYEQALDFWPLNKDLSDTVKEVFFKDTNISPTGKTVFQQVYEFMQRKLEAGLDSESGFDNILDSFGFDLDDDSQLFLIWHVDKNIDIVQVKTLRQFWKSIWYGVGDESLIMYAPNNFVILVCDWGEVGMKDLS